MSLAHLGETRSARRRDHVLHTPDTFVRTTLPGLQRGVAIVHTNPAMGAAFAQYTAELEPGGTLDSTDAQRFIYLLEGAIKVGEQTVSSGGYCFFPERYLHRLEALSTARIAVIEKRYRPVPGIVEPAFFVGNESEVESQALGQDGNLSVKVLIPDTPSHDFAVNIMTYLPGASLSMVEVHVMEHGLVMLQGGGIYRLSDSWYSVFYGDFIWMAPYCPQWFGALGTTPARYLIYKDSNRHPL